MSKRDIKTGGIVPNQFHSTSLHQHCSGCVEPILKTPQCFLLYCTGICFYCIRIVCETYKRFTNYILICVHCNLWVVMTKFLSGHMKLWKMRFVCFICLSRMPSPFSYLSVLTSCSKGTKESWKHVLQKMKRFDFTDLPAGRSSSAGLPCGV